MIAGTHVYYSSGTYLDTLQSSNGCDSILTTLVTLIIPDTAVSISGNTLSAVAGATAYQWVLCDSVNSLVPGATMMSFSPTGSGLYAVWVTEGNCSALSGCYPVIVTSDENEDIRRTYVYPNPVKNTLYIHAEMSEDQSFRIYSTDGSLETEGLLHRGTQDLDMSRFAAGLFILQMQSGECLRFVKH